MHQCMQDAVETDRKELDESKQMPAGAQSTDPGGDALAQMEYPLQIADERGAAMCNHRANQRVFKEMDYVKTNDQQWYRVVPDACDARKT